MNSRAQFLTDEVTLEEITVMGLHAALLPIIGRLDGVSKNASILDLGCGTGAWLKRLYDAGYRDLLGIDRDDGRFGGREIASFIQADFDAALNLSSLSQPRFSLVTVIEVIEHVANPRLLVETAFRALLPGGYLLITSPNVYSLRARMRFLIRCSLPFFEQAAHSTPIETDHIHPVVLEAYQRKIFMPLNLALVRVWTYPELGSSGSRWFARFVAQAMRMVLNDELAGDTLCLLLRKPLDDGRIV